MPTVITKEQRWFIDFGLYSLPERFWAKRPASDKTAKANNRHKKIKMSVTVSDESKEALMRKIKEVIENENIMHSGSIFNKIISDDAANKTSIMPSNENGDYMSPSAFKRLVVSVKEEMGSKFRWIRKGHKIALMFKDGSSIESIAEYFDLSSDYVRRVLIKRGVLKRGASKPPRITQAAI